MHRTQEPEITLRIYKNPDFPKLTKTGSFVNGAYQKIRPSRLLNPIGSYFPGGKNIAYSHQ